MEIQKDLRLPTGFTSWLQIAKHVDSHDVLTGGLSTAPPHLSVTRVLYGNPSSPAPIETAEYDVLSLKMRAFDELNEIIPNQDALRSMIYELSSGLSRSAQDPSNFKAIKFLEILLQLYSLR